MNVCKINPFKNLSNEELLKRMYCEINRLHNVFDRLNDEEYKKQSVILNSIIIEIKRRKLKIDEKFFYEKNLTDRC